MKLLDFARYEVRLLGVIGLVVAIIAGCSDGKDGAVGSPGAPAPAAGTVVSVASMTQEELRTLTFSLADSKITGVTMSGPPVVRFTLKDSKGRGVSGLGYTSQSATATMPGLTNIQFAVAKLIPDTTARPSRWVSYVVTTVPTKNATTGAITASAPTRPSTDSTGTLKDNGDGTYEYTFWRDIPSIKTTIDGMTFTGANVKSDLDDLTYDPNLTHRVTIQVGGNVRGTGSNTDNGATVVPGVPMQHPINIFYDFIPATGAVVSTSDESREIVNTSSCMECHGMFTWHGGDALDGTPGSRQSTKYCVVCHTDQRKFGRSNTEPDAAGAFAAGASTYRVNSEGYPADANGNKWGQSLALLPKLVHRIHRGENLYRTGYNYAGVQFNHITFPQDIRYCQKCHNGQPDSDNFKNKPSRAACGACHDYINFDTGANIRDAAKPHSVQADDSNCATCHTPTVIESKHIPVEPPNTANSLTTAGASSNTNSAWIAGFLDKLPAGAIKVTFDLKSFAVTANKPVWVFRMLQDDVRADFNQYRDASGVLTGKTELWDNFVGSPSVYAVFAVPQDGNNSPSDFNASVSGYIKNIWKGTATGNGAGTLTGPDASGYYTLTLTGITIPATAKMVTGGLGFTYSLSSTAPLTQTNVPGYPYPDPAQVAIATANGVAGAGATTGGLIVPPHVTWKTATGYSTRRDIVENGRCVKCHAQLGVTPQFHAGERNDPQACAWCHRSNQTSSGWSADSTSFIHAIHAGAKRAAPFTWHAVSTTHSYADITFPGILRNCQTCHLPGTYDFSATASAAAEPNRLFRTVGQGIYNNVVGGTITTYSYSSASGTCVAGTSSAQTDVGVFSLSPYITPLNYYGLGFSFNAGATTSNLCTGDNGTLIPVTAGASRDADSTTLVNSPTANACFSCHDSSLARAHMEQNGGLLYATRASVTKTAGGALVNMEQCLLCHGPGRVAAIADMHAK